MSRSPTTHVVDTVTTGESGLELAVDPASGVLFVTNPGVRTLSVIDMTSLEVVDTITLGDDPRCLDVDAAPAGRVHHL